MASSSTGDDRLNVKRDIPHLEHEDDFRDMRSERWAAPPIFLLLVQQTLDYPPARAPPIKYKTLICPAQRATTHGA